MATTAPASAPPTSAAMSARQAGEYLGGITEGTLANWRCHGIGPKFVRLGRVGGRVVYRREDLDEFLAAHVEGGA